MAKTSNKATTKSLTITKSLIKYYASIEVGCIISINPHGCGLPLGGYIYAENDTEATKKAKEYGEALTKKLFHNDVINAELGFTDADFHVAQSLSLLSVRVTRDYLIDAWGDAHNETLRNILNNVWCHVKYRDKFKEIIRAYWERDKEELADVFSDECIWWHLADKSFDDACEEVEWETICEEWFHHVADDEDIRCVIDYIRPHDLYPNLDWYKA